MDGTIIQQGTFVSTGAATTIQIRSDVDWMQVYNYTEMAATTANHGFQYYWQRGLAANDGIIYFHPAADHTMAVTTSATGIGAGALGGFTLVDSSTGPFGPAVALTAISTATPPRVTTGSTASLATGDVVILTNTTGAPQFGGYGFTITVIDGTHFDLTNAPTLAVAATAGFWRKVLFPPLFYPRRRNITAITAANPAVVTTAVDHGYTVGQEIRLQVPAAFGMVQMNGLNGTITAVTASTFTLNIDSSGFTTFAFPLAANVPFTPAEAIPFGEDTAQALSSAVDILGDATINTGYIGMLLAAGVTSPAGTVGQTIYWVAGKSFNV